MVDDPFRPLTTGKAAPSAKPAAKTAHTGEWTVIVPVPKNAPAAPAEHFKRGKPNGVYTYRDARGDLVGHVYRHDLADGGKEFYPLTYCRSAKGELAWRWQSWPEPRPLYSLDKLVEKSKLPVIVCEGEKAADAAAELCPDHVCVTSPHGAQSPAKADWSALRSRDVTIWPDADEAGSKYAATVARLLAPIARSVKIVEPPNGAKPGWDAADAAADGWNPARASSFLAAAAPPAATISPSSQRRRSRAAPDDDDIHDGDDKGDAAEPGRRRRQADELLNLIAEIELWHSPEGDAFATVPVGSHFENWSVEAKGFRRWIAGQYFHRTQRGASRQAIDEALCTIQSIAIETGAEHVPYLRIGVHGDDVYLDLADPQWRAVRISGITGWEMIDRPPCKFVRALAMAALPEPEAGGSIDDLRPLVRLDDDGFILFVACLVQAFNPAGPYPILALYGTEGSGKTSLARLWRSLIDPSLAPDSAPPRDEAALCLGAKNSRVVSIDNLSRIAEWLSDAMCRISTGAGIRNRLLYSNDEEVIYYLKRPQTLTAIPEVAQRPDFLSRAVCLTVPLLPKFERRTEAEIAAEAEKIRPLALGALLSGVTSALRRRDEVPPVQLPRMADFATWVWRACPGLGWEPQDFLDAYERNQAIGSEIAFEADGLGGAIVDLLALRPEGTDGVKRWEGTSTKLLDDLPVDEKGRKAKWWPASNQVRNRLRRLQKPLAAKGIVLNLDVPGHDKGRLLRVSQEREPRG